MNESKPTQEDAELASRIYRKFGFDGGRSYAGTDIAQWIADYRASLNQRSGDATELLRALKRIATVDHGGGFLGAAACRKIAQDAIDAYLEVEAQ